MSGTTMGRDNRAHKQTLDLPSRHHCAPCDRLSMYSCTTVMFSTYLFYNGYTELVEIGCFCSLFYMTIIEHINKLSTYLADTTVHRATAWVCIHVWLLCFLHTYSIIAVQNWLNSILLTKHFGHNRAQTLDLPSRPWSIYLLYVLLLCFLHT